MSTQTPVTGQPGDVTSGGVTSGDVTFGDVTSGGVTFGAGTAVRLVAGREIRTRLRSKAFRITTIVMLVLVVGFILAAKLLGGSASTVGFTPQTAALSAPLTSTAAAVGQTITVSTVDEAAGEAAVRAGHLDALVVGTPDHFRVIVKKDLSSNLSSAFNVLARQLALNQQLVAAGADPTAVAAAVSAARVDVTSLEPATTYQTARIVLGVIAGILVYVALMLYGQAVAQGVVEEKSSRIVEILLTTIRPWQLMLGKVTGIGVVGLSQMVLLIVAGVTAGLATHTISFPTSIAASAAVWALVWFLLGYTMYAFVFAALASLVSRQEDVSAAVTPVLMVIVLPYVLGISILPADPQNKLLAVASLIPFFSPLLMPMRLAIGVAPAWEGVLAAGMTLVVIVGLVWLSGRMYRNAVLRTGSRVSLRDALRSTRT